LILGGGPAGIAAAKAVRKAKEDAEILIATDEKVAPYLRPLMPDFILGDATRGEHARPGGEGPAAEEDPDRIRARGRPLDTGSRTVTFSDGTQERYDRLLVATGARVRRSGGPAEKKSPMIQPFDS
jgi:3-phenylpropionate/trans-cinnamate dioxygenase ferredoxin reductase subunit